MYYMYNAGSYVLMMNEPKQKQAIEKQFSIVEIEVFTSCSFILLLHMINQPLFLP